MKVVNPLNKTPLPSETMVNSGCACACVSGEQADAKSGMWLPWNNCGCSCGGSDSAVSDANYISAFDRAHSVF